MSDKSYKKIIGFIGDEWDEKINDFNREMYQEFLEQGQLSKQTIKQYDSALRIFFTFVYDKCGNKPLHMLRAKDALKFQNFLISKELSPSAIKFKRSVVSSICNFIELYYGDDYPNFRNIFNKAIPSVGNTKKKEKVPLTTKEINTLADYLRDSGEWQKLAYLMFSFSTGCRREESRQILKEVASYDKFVNKMGEQKNYYATHDVRAKGKGREGKVRKFQFDQIAMDAIRKWVEIRGEDDCPYLFVSKKDGQWKQITANTFNSWCDQFSKILGKKVHPHLLRSSKATVEVLENGKSIDAVRELLGHNSTQTTEIYVVRDTSASLDELFD